ncbi:MAG TPA: ABC transporter permease subunit [Candidatus Limnocylindrales bacterium]|jgi:ABC-type transport system involved in multi-copper enzyme maturation permease subunit|nr:ABC transporter permease subunit [Candidatus Limnocylindrales bacterium]
MTASISTPALPVQRPAAFGDRFAGIRPLAAKDLADWRHGRRLWIIVAVVTAFMALAAANNWIISQVIAAAPDVQAPDRPMSMVPIDNVLAAVASQIFIFAAIFGSMSLIVAERERGTLSWVASKPVGRGGILVAKWASATVAIGLAAAVVPLAITTAVVSALYGPPSIGAIVLTAAGMLAAIAFFVAVAVAVSTFVANQAAVAAIGFAVLLLPGIVGALLPFDIAPFLPTSIVGWSIGFGLGAPVGIATPIAWAVGMIALGAIAVWRVDRLEL